MPETKEVGNGVRLVDTSTLPNPVDQFKGQLSLIDLVGKIRQQPLDEATKQLGIQKLQGEIGAQPAELQRKQAEADIASNQVQMLGIKNSAARAELAKLQSDVVRQKREEFINRANSIVDMTNRSPEYAKAYLQTSFPGSDLVDNKDGTFTAIMPGQKGHINQFTYNPKGEAEPAKIMAAEQHNRSDFEKSPEIQGFAVIDQNWKSMQKNAQLRTAAGDLAMVFNGVKIDNPGAAVREGTLDALSKVQGISDEIKANVRRYYETGGKSGIFADDEVRQNFLNAQRANVESSRANAVQVGQTYFGLSHRGQLNPLNVVRPVSSIPIQDMVPDDLKEKYANLFKGSLQAAPGGQQQQPTYTPPIAIGNASRTDSIGAGYSLPFSGSKEQNSTPIKSTDGGVPGSGGPSLSEKLDSILQNNLLQR